MFEGLEFYIGVGLILAAGLVYIFLIQDSGKKKSFGDDAENTNPDELTDEQKAELEKKKRENRSEALHHLVVPACFPEM